MYFKKKIKEIENILQSDWQPLGGDTPEDEYRSYALKIYSHLERGATEDDIKNLLISFEQEDMELMGDETNTQKVAEKLVQIGNNDYIYLKITLPDEERKEKNKVQKYLKKLLTILLPKQNPDFDKTLDEAETWLLEFENKISPPIREIGVDKNGDIIMKMPYKNNFGYWTDNNLNLDDFTQKFHYADITQEEFEKSWNNL